LRPVNVGILGLGTVGSGTFTVLGRNRAEMARRIGRDIQVVMAAERDLAQVTLASTDGVSLVDDAFQVVSAPAVDIVVELIGGDTIAKDLVMQAIRNGKHVVTANKALIAKYGNEIFAAAEAQGVCVGFEAAVAGGIPIVKAIREGLAGNKIEWLAGIINGTGNFILTEMRDKGRDFESVLAEAQALGYAEADPELDVGGGDAAHKLTILASLAFGMPLCFSDCYMEGITNITQQDVAYAEALGFRIKHLGIAAKREAGVELRVHPTLIPETQLIANVNGVMNAVLVQGDAVGETLYYGAGAGAEATGSAVIADIVDIARTIEGEPAHRVPSLAFQADAITALPVLPIAQIDSAYYVRLSTDAQASRMTDIAQIFGEQGIGIDSMMQKGEEASVIVLTQITREANLDSALDKIQAKHLVTGDIMRIRVAYLNG